MTRRGNVTGMTAFTSMPSFAYFLLLRMRLEWIINNGGGSVMSGLDSLHALLQEELKDIYDAEKNMARKASAAELKSAFEDHLRQTEEHVKR
jgi:uncharacterized protein DUF892